MIQQPSHAFIIVEVTKNDISNMDLSVITQLIKNISIEPYQYQNTVHILFQGYDHIQKEIFEIKEIRNWVEKLVYTYPEIIYFLENELNGLQNIFLCIADYSMVKKLHDSTQTADYVLSAQIPMERAETMLVQMSFNGMLTRHPLIMEQVTNRIVSFASN